MRFFNRIKQLLVMRWRRGQHDQKRVTSVPPAQVTPPALPQSPVIPPASVSRFATALKRRGLIELAEDICNSWRDGYIGQDADGWAILYNGPIGVRNEGWCNLRQKTGLSQFLLYQLTPDPDWYEKVLPVKALWQPDPCLNRIQRSFLAELVRAGLDQKAKDFLEKWTPDSWIAMDKDGTTYVYNAEPYLRPQAWITGSPKNGDWIFLANLREPDLDWERCLVSLKRLRQSSQPVVIKPVPADDSPDCWL